MTFIPIFAFQADSSVVAEKYLLRRAGFGPGTNPCIIVGRLECSGLSRNCTYDPYSWDDRTFKTAHLYIEKHFDELCNGEVIDVEFILGETEKPKLSELFE